MTDTGNIDHKTVDGFGEEWAAFDQTDLPPDEQRCIFDDYFSVFPFAKLPEHAQGFDLGCGLTDIVFREGVPYWVACGRKR